MPHVVEYILKLDQVGSVRFHKSLVSLKHLALVLFPARLFLFGFAKFKLIGPILDCGSSVLHMEELIESKAAEKTSIAVVHIDRAQTALAEFAKAESDPCECTHEGRIHLLAIAQIDDKIPVPTLDHLLHKLFEARAILEGSSAFYFYPYGAFNAAHKDRRCRVHSGCRNYPSPATAVKSLPLLAPHKRLSEGHNPAVDNQQNAPGSNAPKFEVLVARGVEVRSVRASCLGIVSLHGHDVVAEG
jgi:hypothetical protein